MISLVLFFRKPGVTGVNRFGVRGKLAPCYIGPFPIVQQCGIVVYHLKLPEQLSIVHSLCHVSQLKKCLRVLEEAIENEGVELEPDLTYAEYPVRILDQKDRVTRNRMIKFYKVQWNKHSEEEATWELEDYLRENHLDFLTSI
jgi:hypothetical protein